VYYRLGLGGITGHRDFARDTGVIVKPGDAVRVCNAIIRVFIGHGDRTDRTKARLKYLLDRWGLPKFLEAVEQELGETLTRVDPAAILPRPPIDKHGHIGVHEQKQPGLHYVGVACPVGRLSSERLRGLSDIADRFGSGTIRLTVWQNCLISDIPESKLNDALAAIEAPGLDWRASPIRGGLVACTGNAGCKFSASDTKRDAAMLRRFLSSTSRSITRSTFTSPAAITPARNITPPISVCSRPRSSRMTTWSKATTSSSAAAPDPTSNWAV
jgi:ferredoxin-nitrite reductase